MQALVIYTYSAVSFPYYVRLLPNTEIYAICAYMPVDYYRKNDWGNMFKGI